MKKIKNGLKKRLDVVIVILALTVLLTESKVQDIAFILLMGCWVLKLLFFLEYIFKKDNNGSTVEEYLNQSVCDEISPLFSGETDIRKNSLDIPDKNTKITFQDVAGLKEVKKDLSILVDFLKNKQKYADMGASIPKGVILYGPSGTGKTLLAKAVAGEAGIPFFYISGSSFDERYVGVGAQRVRSLFELAKKNAPCIVFIDEIDALCRSRNSIAESSGRQTINEFLTQMDGFEESSGVLVIGATNRIEDIDEAVLRPGRFTNKYCVPLPETSDDRLEIINIHAKNKRFMDDVDFNQLAKLTTGCSPAFIESVLNEAAIIAASENLCAIDTRCINEAFDKALIQGHMNKNNSHRDRKELELVAWHEAGHALADILFGNEVNKVTILSSTTGAGGITFHTPKQTGLHSVSDLKAKIIALYAGRCAEYLYTGDKELVTTGARSDIEYASNLIYSMVAELGMCDIGMLNLKMLHTDNDFILDEASKLAKKMESASICLLKKHREELEQIALLLLEKETLYEADLSFVTARESVTEICNNCETMLLYTV